MKRTTPQGTARRMTMTQLIRCCSAFKNYAELRFSIEQHGYTPTVRTAPLHRLGRTARFQQAARNELARRLIHAGRPVYTGKRLFA